MSILTGVVLMIVLGTVIQNGERLANLFTGGSTSPVLMSDTAEVVVDVPTLIDVLANDRNVDDEAAARLAVVYPPRCGRTSVQEGRIKYLADADCVGRHSFVYGIGQDDISSAEVRLHVRAAREPAREPVADRAPELAEVSRRAAPDRPRASPVDGRATVGTASSTLRRGIAGPARPIAPTREISPRIAGRPDAPDGGPEPALPAEPGVAGTAPLVPDLSGEGDVRAIAATRPQMLESPRSAEPAKGAAAVRARTDFAALDPSDGPDVTDAPLHLSGTSTPAARPLPAAVAGPLAGEEGAPTGIAAPEVPATHAPGLPSSLSEPEDGGDAPELIVAASPGEASPSRMAAFDLSEPVRGFGKLGQPVRLEAEPLEDEEAVPDFELALLSGEVPEDAGFAPLEGIGASAPEPDEPRGLEATPTLSLARIDIPEPGVAPGEGHALVDLEAAAVVDRSGPPLIDRAADAAVAPGSPADDLAPAPQPGAALPLAPVTIDDAPPRQAPDESPDETAASVETVALPDPQDDQDPAEAATGNQPAEAVAALPAAEASCAVPPELALQPGRAALTTLAVRSPCHAGTTAVVDYSGLELAVPLDPDGAGAIDVPGFASSAEAVLRFADGTAVETEIPFRETQRIERVALSWGLPVRLDLHALEFGAEPGSPGHVGPDNPRSFRAVRRTGGGFLQSFAPVDGRGDHVQVYTHYLRRGGSTGVVEMMIDFASRRQGEPGTCGTGELASPGFTITRSAAGRGGRPLRRQLAPIACDTLPGEGSRMVTNALNNIVITY